MPERVRILSETTRRNPVAPGEWKNIVTITYAAEGMMPRRVFIDEEDLTDAERIRVIGEDLREARARVMPELEIPDAPESAPTP